MKRNVLALSIFLIPFILFSFSKPVNKEKIPETITGLVHVYGNDPFSYIGIVTDDKKKYTIIADDDVLIDLRKSQGNKIQISGFITKNDNKNEITNMLKDGKINVIEWKYVK